MSLLFDLAIRPSAIVLAGLVLTAMLRHRSAAVRHCVLAASVFGALAVVPLNRVLPAWQPVAVATPEVREAVSHPVPGRATRETGQDPPAGRATVLSLVAVVWGAGLVAGFAVLLTGFCRLVRLTARAGIVRDDRWARQAEQVAARYRLRRPVTLLQTDAPDLLATWGLFRPCVLLPAQAPQWRDDRIRAVLCHELAHIRRHDWLVTIGAEMVRIVYWFNPLLWMACTRLRRESEQACDDAVLGAGVSPCDYAAHLLELARTCRRAGPTWVSAMLMARPSTLERRISAMLNPRIHRGALSRRAVAFTGAVLFAVTLPAAAVGPGQNAPLPLVGAVYDASGAVVPGVALTLEDAQEITLEATTDAAGRFAFPPVQPGRYLLEASLKGFRPLRHEFDLRSAADWDRAITLQVGELRETITVRERRVTAERPPPQVQAPLPVRVGGNIRAPRKLHHVRPVYPATMRGAGREGIVPIEAIIGRDGAVLSLRVLSAHVHPDFAVAAVDAVRQWRFDATLLNGVAVDVMMTVSVEFRLSD